MGHLVQREHPQNWGGIGVGSLRSTKNLQHLRNGARQDQGYNDRLIGSRIRAFDWYQNQRPWMTLNGVSTIQGLPKFLSTRILSQERVKLRTLKLANIFRGPSKQKPIKNLGERERGCTRDCPKFLNTPYIISGTGIATNFKFCTHFHTIDYNKSPR